jgi:hypothetical protein
MDNFKFQVWSKTGGLLTEVNIKANNHAQAKQLVENQNPGTVVRGGFMTR